MPTASIVVPAYNASRTLPETLRSLLCQTYRDFEIIVVDDGSSDETAQVAGQFATDPRLRIVRQTNRGLAGARNSGIAAARADYVGFCDADDLWVPHKLDVHIRHLDANPDVALSYSGSKLIDEDGAPLGIVQKPRRRGVTPAHVFKRNPIGNGSAVVARRVALTDIAYRPHFESERDWVFDETFRQSEDIECWLRLMLTTDWQIEGVAQLLTEYRISSHGLSASIDQQLDAWERMVTKLTDLNPEFFDTHADAARAYQYRYLARRAISLNLARRGYDFAWQSLQMSRKPLIEEPIKTLSTLAAAEVLKRAGALRLRQAMTALTAIKRF